MMSVTALTHVHCCGCPSCVNPLYRKLGSGSSIVRTRVDLNESWNKPEKANQWRTKLTQIEDFEE